MRIGVALRELHGSETALAGELLRLADRHAKEQEIYHVAQDLVRWSRDHVREIAAVGPRYGLELEEPDLKNPEPPTEEAGELPGDGSDPDLLLLADLRRLYRMAAGVSLDWDLLGQGAQVVADAELLALTKRCHPQSLRQMKWADAMLKTVSPQILAG
ncbi:hypothetical protein A6A08_03280 [Nocardiopsis sp. TSRI0078]|uniref:hypothetical protein n=1 Tax=unclassified Nocardiopsis TaxID=2649073 RepID=UPI000938B350|nr:hypothetical protein [Nocardiopsis sp. TSRI0078]OKI23796.1 hypothetical protein A6A08_03280 [Nocardiopsis sp. TSRI0078]